MFSIRVGEAVLEYSPSSGMIRITSGRDQVLIHPDAFRILTAAFIAAESQVESNSNRKK